MEVYSKSDIGMVRKSNQDDVNFKVIAEDICWAVVCDGMGGANGGDIASKTAVNVITKSLTENLHENVGQDIIEDVIKNAIYEANNQIYEVSKEKKELSGMGTTVVLAMVCRGMLHIAHVGDSRAYITSEKGIQQVTQDHSIVQELINTGEITKEEASTHPRKNIITRVLGIGSEINVDYNSFELQSDEKIILCTDGLTNDLSDEQIYNIFKENEVINTAERLVNAAKEKGGNDNITVAVIVQ